ncbi:ribosomal protein S6 kinase-related protein-like [Simochromis diagramma]|uniref:ribosomal protein S6 kinase-related protein-like n=1 Tax=Simochromis diagramma TaxID=43689 RepID=UPI001A7EB629|nr:ribosomal protein S6 kinase-related protein-like [Simochromis diagramma]
MGGEVSKNRKSEGPAAQRRFSHGFLSNVGVSIVHRLGHSAVFSRPVGADSRQPIRLLLPPEDGAEASGADPTPPAFISVFLPEFPHPRSPGAVKRGSHHSVCDYCSTGDLHTCWLLRGHFGEEEVRLIAAELGSALGFLHDLGIMHRDIKMENILLNDQGHLRLSDFGLSRRLKRGGRAFTICGTIQYMAPEILSGGPYNHAADWWSLGIMLFSLVTGKFPLMAEIDHCRMLAKVRDFSYVVPETFSSALILLLTELLCKNPMNRLRNLECFKMQTFFRGTSFDPYILQKTPVEFILELRTHPDWAAKSARGFSLDYFDNFDCDQILHSPVSPSEVMG